jgi:hypothetical protein
VTSLDAFTGPEPPDAAGRELILPPPRQGGTWSLRWLAADGGLICSGTPLFEATADSNASEQLTEPAPLPCRLRISRPSGRYLPSGVIGRLEYGPALQAGLGRTAQEHRRLTQAIAQLQTEAAALNKQLQAPAVSLSQLAERLRTGLHARPAARELPPLALVQLTELFRQLVVRFPAAVPASSGGVAPLSLQKDRAQAALERWCADRIARVRANAAGFPPDIAAQAVIIWETLLTFFSEQLSAGDQSSPGRQVTV